jgi:hypothetical protein
VPRLSPQQQLILQQPNGLIWLRVCAKLRIVPTLQHVHQYDAALKLVTDDGHKPSEEIYTCIVSEQNKHVQQQMQTLQMQQEAAARVNRQRLTALAPPAPSFSLPAAACHGYSQRSYSVTEFRLARIAIKML